MGLRALPEMAYREVTARAAVIVWRSTFVGIEVPKLWKSRVVSLSVTLYRIISSVLLSIFEERGKVLLWMD